MKSCVEEYKNCSVDDIANKYIEGTPQIDAAVDREDVTPLTKGPVIQGMNIEDKDANEGTALYDIRFFALAPGQENEFIKLIINVEAQQNDKPGYSLVRRGIYYCSRLVSAEKKVEFDKTQYDQLKKVYSIWICYSSTQAANTITRFHMTKEDLVGQAYVAPREYDLLQVIMIRLGAPKEAETGTLLHMLDTVFSKDVQLSEKKDALENDYGIQMSVEFKEELSQMCNMSEGIRAEALKEGENRFALLVKKLLQAGRVDDIDAAAQDDQVRVRLMKEYGLIPS